MAYNFDEIIERRNTNSIKWTEYPEEVLPLWVADMDFQTPEPIRNALHTALDRGVLGYEFLKPRTQQVVAARMDRLYGRQVAPEWIVATSGVVSGFNIAARAVCNPGDGALVQPPVYHMFYSIYKNMGLTKQVAPFSVVNEGSVLIPQLDLDVFARSFHSNDARTRMFLLCHPHNPMGNVFSMDELKGMAEICLQNEAVIVSDEIHSELLWNGSKHAPLAALSGEIAEKPSPWSPRARPSIPLGYSVVLPSSPTLTCANVSNKPVNRSPVMFPAWDSSPRKPLFPMPATTGWHNCAYT